MLIIILYVLTIILYADHKCLLYLKIYFDKNGNTTYIKHYYCNNVYLIINYRNKHTLAFHSIPSSLIPITFGSVQVINYQRDKIALCFRSCKSQLLYDQTSSSILDTHSEANGKTKIAKYSRTLIWKKEIQNMLTVSCMLSYLCNLTYNLIDQMHLLQIRFMLSFYITNQLFLMYCNL